MVDVIVVGGFAGYDREDSFAMESPFLLYKDETYCDIPGMFKKFVDSSVMYAPQDVEAPPFVCYALKQVLHNKGYTSDMIFYLDLEINRMKTILEKTNIAVFLSTTLISNKQQLKRAVDVIRRYSKDATIVCGGPFVDRSWAVRNKVVRDGNELYGSCAQDHLFLDNIPEDACGVDIFVYNDPALQSATSLLEELKKGTSPHDIAQRIPNCAHFKGEKWSFSPKEEARTPCVHFIDWSLFRTDEMRSSVPMVRSKGCPNHCRFCNFQSLSKFQEKDLNLLRTELKTLRECHEIVKNIYFCDDNICGNRKSINDFATFISEFDSPFQWMSFFDARFIDDHLAEKLKQSGCSLLKIGMESADDSILKNMKKPCRVSQYKTAVSALVKAGISIDAYFIVGYPGETEKTIKNTIDNINSFDMASHSSNQLAIFPFILAPLAPIFENEERKKFELNGYMLDWNHSTMNSKTAFELIPEIMGQVKSLNAQHGNVDRLMVRNREILSKIDRTRGDLIRNRLSGNVEQTPYWEELERLVTQLKPKTQPAPDGSVQLLGLD